MHSMSKKRAFTVVMLLALAMHAYCDIEALMQEADRLHEEARDEEAKDLLLKSLEAASSGREQAEVYWRLARAHLNMGDEAEKNNAPKDTILAFFADGEQYGQKAIDLDEDSHVAYYWRAANIGRWGQVRGVLNSLFKAAGMHDLLVQAITINPDYSDAYYVLGQLYEQVPSVISFGNVDFAVSLGRKAVHLHEQEVRAGVEQRMDYDFFTELAKHLYARDWSSAKRAKKRPKQESRLASSQGILERSFYYEASIPLVEIADRDEALELARWVVSELEATPERLPEDEDDLQEVRDLLADWGEQ